MFRALAIYFPKMPENMLGGIIGWLVGTHPLRNNYDPDSAVVLALSRPCWAMSNRNERWRREVYQWLHEQDAVEAASRTGQTVAEPDGSGLSTGQIRYGGVVVECEVGAFSPAQRIFNFEDYERNCCWICQDASSEWDMWNSCRHVFCKKCSGEMMRRRMPCPLCRVRSDQVLRRGAFGTAAGLEHGSGEIASSMLEQGDLVREPEGLVGAPNPISMPLVAPQAHDDHNSPEEGDVQMALRGNLEQRLLSS